MTSFRLVTSEGMSARCGVGCGIPGENLGIGKTLPGLSDLN